MEPLSDCPTEKESAGFLLIVALLFATLTMRGPITCVGVMTEEVRRVFDIGYAQYGFLNALPVAAFGLGSFAAAAAAARLGVTRTVAASLLLILSGASGRLFDCYGVLLACTAAVGIGIAFLNVLMPVLLRDCFARRLEAAMGVFTALIGLSGAIGLYATAPLLQTFHTIAAPFGLWVGISAAAVLFWILAPKCKTTVSEGPRFFRGMAVEPMAWALTAVMGLQSLTIYTTAAWLPTLLRDAGFSEGRAGFAAALFLLASVPASLFSPWIIRRLGGERRTSLFVALNFAAGVALWPAGGAVSFAGCLAAGVSQGLCLSLAMLAMSKKSETRRDFLLISGFAQGVGYVVAGAGPWACGLLYGASRANTGAVVFLLAAILLWGVAAWYAFGGRRLCLKEKDWLHSSRQG